MDNLEYLEKIKKSEEEWLDNIVIKNQSNNNETQSEEAMEYRKAKALEIIAEELIKINSKMNSVIRDNIIQVAADVYKQ